MADRLAAEIFADIFSLLATKDSPTSRGIAADIFKITAGYDFEPEQMGVDSKLVLLGCARYGVNPDERLITFYNTEPE